MCYYKLLPDGEEELQNEEDSKRTGTVITENVGSEKDFDVTVLATGRNLEDLVDAKPTESGSSFVPNLPYYKRSLR